MVDVVAIPDRLQQPVGKAQNHDVLHRFLAEIMIDAKNLTLVEVSPENAIKLFGGFEIRPKRLFDHHSAPMIALLMHETGVAQALDHTHERTRGYRKVKQVIAVGAGLSIDFV